MLTTDYLTFLRFGFQMFQRNRNPHKGVERTTYVISQDIVSMYGKQLILSKEAYIYSIQCGFNFQVK